MQRNFARNNRGQIFGRQGTLFAYESSGVKYGGKGIAPLLRLLANVALKHTMTIILKAFKIERNIKIWDYNFTKQKYGQIFFEHQLPALIKAINRLANVGEKKIKRIAGHGYKR